MEEVRKQGEHSLLKINVLIEELRNKGADAEMLDELTLESARAIDDIMRLIAELHRKKKIQFRVFARFVEVPFAEKDSPRYARIVAIKVEVRKVKNKVQGDYIICWNKNHPMNIRGKCMSAVVNKENTTLSALVALATAVAEMKIRALSLHIEDDRMSVRVRDGNFSSEKSTQRLVKELKETRQANKIKWKIMNETYIQNIEHQYGQIRFPKDERIRQYAE